MKPITTQKAFKSLLLMTGVCIVGTTVGCSFHASAGAKAGGGSSGSGSAKTSSSGSAKTSSSGSAKASSSASANAKASAKASGSASSSGHLSASAGGTAKEKTKVHVKSKPKVTGMGCASAKPDFKAAIILKGKAKGGISVRGGATAGGSAKADEKTKTTARQPEETRKPAETKAPPADKTNNRNPEETRKPTETTTPPATTDKTRPGTPNPRRTAPAPVDPPAPVVEETRPGKPNPRRTAGVPDPVVEKTRPGKPNPRRRVPQAEDPAPQEPITPPEEPPENDFGYEVPVRGCFEGLVYPLQPGAQKLPSSFDRLDPVSVVYACEWDIPVRSWSTGFPGVDDLFEWFAIRYTGAFAVDRPGSYSFRVSSDDGVKLFIDGKLVINNDGVHPPVVKNGRVELTRGDHQMVLEYFQGPRYHINLQLYATPPGGEEGLFSVR